MINEFQNWNVEDAINTYQVDRWSEGYFNIDEQGRLVALTEKNPNGPKICLEEIIKEMKKENIAFPAVIRFHDILRSQVHTLNNTFDKTIAEANFQGQYYGVFPIKVNQLREVIEEVVDAGKNFNYGLEAGSKTELLAVLAYNNNVNSLTILNGYKDREYIELANLGVQMGKNIVVVVEKFSELQLLIDVYEKTGTIPTIGIRARLSSKGSGKWADSTGEKAKFGLSSLEVIEAIEILKQKDLLSHLQLFHFHIGSQIPDIRTIKECITEGARMYCDIRAMGAPIEYFDVGGGLGLNYDGTRSSSLSSTNYTLEDYVGDVIYIVKDICDDTETKHPNIVTETGRAVAAYHSCVVTNVFGNIEMTNSKSFNCEPDENDHLLLKNMKSLYRELNFSNYQDIYNDACIIKDEAMGAFKLGVIGLKERATVEGIYSNIAHQILDMTANEKYVPLEIKKLKYQLADKYLCNFSVFQSTPDSWAIGQVLPIVPLSNLNIEPTKQCTLADITCDSDGKIDHFLGPDGNMPTIPLHNIEKGKDYHVGVFLTGAYQDIMGDMHNLFGRLNEVHVYVDQEDPSGFYIEEILQGNSSAQVLKIMQYNPSEMCKKIKLEIDTRIKDGKIRPRQGIKMVDFYESSIYGYTYLEGF